MTTTVFCVDFDETLMNTDRLRADTLESIRNLGKDELADTYLEAYEATRQEHGVPRIPLVLKMMRERFDLDFESHRRLAGILHDFPYQEYLYADVEQVIAHLKNYGKVLIFSDGDAFFQLEKVRATSVATLVDGIIVLTTKVNYFDDLSGFWPAERYVFIDDKQKVLDAAKEYFGENATTVLVKQGRYADSAATSTADTSVASITEVANLEF